VGEGSTVTVLPLGRGLSVGVSGEDPVAELDAELDGGQVSGFCSSQSRRCHG
jgi:hypothetical protein